MIFLTLQGTPYEMGLHHGRELKYLIHNAIRQRGWHFHGDECPSKETIKRAGDKLKSAFPEMAEEMRGIADGANIPLGDIILRNLNPLKESCSNLVFLCDEGPMLGHTDDNLECMSDVAFRIQRPSGPEIMCVAVAGTIGVGAAVNSHGLAISHSAGRSDGARNSDAFMMPHLLRRAVIERCTTADEAEKLLRKYPLAWSADNIIVLDKHGGAFVAEKLPNVMELRRPFNGALACTNRVRVPLIATILNQDAYEKENIGTDGIRNLIERDKYLNTAIADNAGKYSLELMKQVLCSTAKGAEVCNKLSNWAAIMFPARFEMLIADRPPCYHKFIPFNK